MAPITVDLTTTILEGTTLTICKMAWIIKIISKDNSMDPIMVIIISSKCSIIISIVSMIINRIRFSLNKTMVKISICTMEIIRARIRCNSRTKVSIQRITWIIIIMEVACKIKTLSTITKIWTIAIISIVSIHPEVCKTICKTKIVSGKEDSRIIWIGSSKIIIQTTLTLKTQTSLETSLFTV